MADKNEEQSTQQEEKQNENVQEEQQEQDVVNEQETAEEGAGGVQDVGEAKKEDKEETKDIPSASELKPGMTVRVYQKIKELNMKKEEKERIQYFEGIIIAKKHNTETGGSITLRRVANGIGVEKIFPLNLPTITKIEIKKQAKVRRSKLYFLKRGYKKRLKEKKVSQ